jgi:hypothetical protein
MSNYIITDSGIVCVNDGQVVKFKETKQVLGTKADKVYAGKDGRVEHIYNLSLQNKSTYSGDNQAKRTFFTIKQSRPTEKRDDHNKIQVKKQATSPKSKSKRIEYIDFMYDYFNPKDPHHKYRTVHIIDPPHQRPYHFRTYELVTHRSDVEQRNRSVQTLPMMIKPNELRMIPTKKFIKTSLPDINSYRQTYVLNKNPPVVNRNENMAKTILPIPATYQPKQQQQLPQPLPPPPPAIVPPVGNSSPTEFLSPDWSQVWPGDAKPSTPLSRQLADAPSKKKASPSKQQTDLNKNTKPTENKV